MVRVLLFAVGVLLALASMAWAEKKDGIFLYPFVTDVCYGNPIGSPVYVELEQCAELQANSLKPMVHVIRNWIEKSNRQEHECSVITYKTKHCTRGDEIEYAPIPKMLSQCMMSLEPDTPIFSAKFTCRPKKFEENQDVATSWDIGWDDKPTPHVPNHVQTRVDVVARATPDPKPHGPPVVPHHNNEINVENEEFYAEWHDSLKEYPVDEASGGDVTPIEEDSSDEEEEEEAPAEEDKVPVQKLPVEEEVTARVLSEEETPEASIETTSLEPREEGPLTDVANVWMLHPWSLTLLCYKCYTEHKKNFNNFQCRSGPNHVGHCGAPPPTINGEPVPYEPKKPGPGVSRLARRASWHKGVFFISPFVPGLIVCGDAEWEKRGQPETEIRLQRITPCPSGIIWGQDLAIPF